MTRPASHERVYRLLLRLYPEPFRSRFGGELVQLSGDLLRDAREGRSRRGVVRTWLGLVLDVALTAPAEHLEQRRIAHSLTRPASSVSKALGAVGILGGLLLVAAYIPNLVWSEDVFVLRLVVLNGGAIAIAIALYPRLASIARWQATLATAGVLLTNAWHLVLIVAIVAPPGPPYFPDVHPMYGQSQVAMWLADAIYGSAALVLGGAAGLAALTLTLGSVFAILYVTFGALGVALVGVGWIALGLRVGRDRRRPAPVAVDAG
ncbi:MAG: hypothetical protein L0227_08310 [Chloroflexi bacterium]|nr:hypothetical protein [Chloroflexota bacterium]